MKNVTISMDEELLAAVRVEAAKAGKSVSSFVSSSVAEKLEALGTTERDVRRNVQLDAIERFLAGPPLHISVDGRMPTAEERNRRGLSD